MTRAEKLKRGSPEWWTYLALQNLSGKGLAECTKEQVSDEIERLRSNPLMRFWLLATARIEDIN